MSTIRTTRQPGPGARPAAPGRRTDPFAALAQLDATFEDLVRRSFGAGGATSHRPSTGFVPAVDMEVADRDVVIRLELPGVDVARDVAIEVDRGRLVVSGQRAERSTGDRTGVLVREHRYGSFRREFALPEGTDPAGVSATYDAGILEVRLAGVLRPDPEPVRVPVQVRTAEAAQATIEHDDPDGPRGDS